MGTRSRAAPRLTLHECKIRASLLLKSLLSSDPSRAAEAAERLRLLPPFASLSTAELLTRTDAVQHKHALAVIAHEQGASSWAELKHTLESAKPEFSPEALFARPHSAFLKRWFSSLDEARESLQAQGGILFPFRQQFFICEPDFLRSCGIDTADPDWERIGFNWVEPRDPEARDRLAQKLIALGLTR